MLCIKCPPRRDSMKTFMGPDFLLDSEPAKILYESAKDMPICDYHCHIDPQEIAQDKRYSNITEVWLGGDHYKWRLLRANGFSEAEVTGARYSDPRGLFKRFVKTLPQAVGNPIYHWSYLELLRYFDVPAPVSEEGADALYDLLNQKLETLTVRQIINKSNVAVICTTDDPADTLEWHDFLAGDSSFKTQVLPAFRPDKAMAIDKPDFAEYVAKLEAASGSSIGTFDDLAKALENRIDFFASKGCRASDHALEAGVFALATPAELDLILEKALNGKPLSALETEKHKTALLAALAKKYHDLGWGMQIHFGCRRNNNTRLFRLVGADTGFDSMNNDGGVQKMSQFLDYCDSSGGLPRTILYSLNPGDSEALVTIAGCFNADAECPGKVQIGSAWWFLDSKAGMEKQLLDFSNGTLLANFNGMLTDSRSFLSYARHEYFRRILCNFVGGLVESGQAYPDLDQLSEMIKDICFRNVMRYFGFKEKA
jgi:glucuronate isomerase